MYLDSGDDEVSRLPPRLQLSIRNASKHAPSAPPLPPLRPPSLARVSCRAHPWIGIGSSSFVQGSIVRVARCWIRLRIAVEAGFDNFIITLELWLILYQISTAHHKMLPLNGLIIMGTSIPVV